MCVQPLRTALGHVVLRGTFARIGGLCDRNRTRRLRDVYTISGSPRVPVPLVGSVATERQHCFARRYYLRLAQGEHRAFYMHMQLPECTTRYKVVDGGERCVLFRLTCVSRLDNFLTTYCFPFFPGFSTNALRNSLRRQTSVISGASSVRCCYFRNTPARF